jgi:hypothetical protein
MSLVFNGIKGRVICDWKTLDFDINYSHLEKYYQNKIEGQLQIDWYFNKYPREVLVVLDRKDKGWAWLNIKNEDNIRRCAAMLILDRPYEKIL